MAFYVQCLVTNQQLQETATIDIKGDWDVARSFWHSKCTTYINNKDTVLKAVVSILNEDGRVVGGDKYMETIQNPPIPQPEPEPEPEQNE